MKSATSNTSNTSNASNAGTNNLPETPPNDVTSGLDWARDDHAVAFVDACGRDLLRHSVDRTATGLSDLVRVLRDAGCRAVASVPTDRSLMPCSPPP